MGIFLEICLTYLEAHHREVIVRFGAGAMGFYLGLQRIDDLPTRFVTGLAQDVEQTTITKLLLLCEPTVQGKNP